MTDTTTKTRNRRLRRALGVTRPESKPDRLAEALDYRTKQAGKAIDAGADPQTAWIRATEAASKVYGLHVPEVWDAARMRQAVRDDVYRPNIKPPRLVAPQKRPEPLGLCDDEVLPDPRFPRRNRHQEG